ncbi:MAG: threonine synthase [Acidimicrobiia bacterium]
MQYRSSRGVAPVLGFADVLLAGLASDGGLYVPERWPELSIPASASTYAEVATAVMYPFVEGSIPEDDFAAMVADAYSTFSHPEVVPLIELEPGLYLLELFHGPTLAFKDVALQLVGRLFDYELAKRGERVTIVGATSGDTGAAAIEALREREAIDVVILHPKGKVSEVQRRFMTSVDAPNVRNVAIEGTFDDAQDMVKAMFADTEFRQAQRLSAVNSINFARVMAQTVYYVTAQRALAQPVSFAVPTGNFGNVYAGYGAMRMGVPIRQLVIGSNSNDILTRTLATGEMAMGEVAATLSPAMDIQVSSNFERLIFDMLDHNGEAVQELMERFRLDRRVVLPPAMFGRFAETFSGSRLDDQETLTTMREVYESTGKIIDPHTAVGVGAAKAHRGDATSPMVVLATAHPAKFPEAVNEAIGVKPELPEAVADLFDRPEHLDELPNDLAAIKTYVANFTAR